MMLYRNGRASKRNVIVSRVKVLVARKAELFTLRSQEGNHPSQNNFCSTLRGKMLQPIWPGPFVAGEISRQNDHSSVFSQHLTALWCLRGQHWDHMDSPQVCAYLVPPQEGVPPTTYQHVLISIQHAPHCTARSVKEHRSLGKAWNAQYSSCSTRFFVFLGWQRTVKGKLLGSYILPLRN